MNVDHAQPEAATPPRRVSRSALALVAAGALTLTACAPVPGSPSSDTASTPVSSATSTPVSSPTESSAPSTTVTVTVAVPTVTVGRGASHQTSTCTVSACAYVQVTTSGFASKVTCQITKARVDITNFSPWTQGPNATKDSPNYYGWPGTSIKVECTDGISTASGKDPSW